VASAARRPSLFKMKFLQWRRTGGAALGPKLSLGGDRDAP